MTTPSLSNLALASKSTFPSATIEPATTPTLGALNVVLTDKIQIKDYSVFTVRFPLTASLMSSMSA